MQTKKQTIVLGTSLILTISLLMAVNVNATWRYRLLERRVEVLKEEQLFVYEENKRLLGDISQLESPQRLLQLIEDHQEWQLKQLTPGDTLLITINEGGK
jgi:hypothetical protein